jgi:pantoate--beta-alanine ligase
MAFDAGERETSVLERAGRAVLDARPSVRLEYFAVVDGATLEPVSHAREDAVAIVAARVGATRLIDNRVLGRP